MASLMLLIAAPALTSCKRASTAAQPGEGILVRAQLSTNVIHVGDPVSLSIEIEHPSDGQIDLPDFSNGKAVVSRELQKTTTGSGEQGARSRFDYSITSFEVGPHVVSTGAVRFTRSDGSTIEAPIPFLAFTVDSLLSDTNTAPRDIKELADWPRPSSFWIVLAALGSAILIAVIVYAIRHLRRRKEAGWVAPPPPPAHEIALRSLLELLERRYIEEQRYEAFYVAISNIVRTYLEARFTLRAPEQTTEEFIHDTSISHKLSSEHQALVVDFLTQCDLVKFARYAPDAESMRRAYAAAERLVRETIPAPPTFNHSTINH